MTQISNSNSNKYPVNCPTPDPMQQQLDEYHRRHQQLHQNQNNNLNVSLIAAVFLFETLFSQASFGFYFRLYCFALSTPFFHFFDLKQSKFY
jgi:hypothetical protein